jgi:hypothetical protein
MVNQTFVLRQGIRTRLGLRLNSSNEDHATFGEINNTLTALFNVAIPQFAIHHMPNPAWDDPSTSHVFHPPLYAPTPSAPDLEDPTRCADALRQTIEAAESMDDDPDDEYSEPAIRPLSGRRIALLRDQFNLEGLDDDQLAIIDRWFGIDAGPEESRTSHQQVLDLATELRNLPHPTSFEAIGRSTIYKRLEECGWTGQREGRRQIIPPAELSKLEKYLLDRFGSNNPARYVNAWNWVNQNCQTALGMATLRNCISEMPALRIIQGIPMEQDRVFSDPAQIGLHYATLEAAITRKPAALVINLDETGHQAWADAHKEFVIGSARFPGKTVFIPVGWSEKMATLLAATAGNGKS